jgi:two-component system, LytTR family, sensor kinase
VSGFLGSFLIYAVCHRVWKRKLNLLASLAWCTPICLLLGFLCSAAAVWAESRFGGLGRSFIWSVALGGTTGNSFLFLAWSAIYFGVKHYQALEQERLQLAQSEALAREAQLQALRYQLQPHFLFNTLNAISTLILDERAQDARKMIALLADLLRNTIEAPDTHHVALSEELLLVDQYLAIEQVRLGNRLRVRRDYASQASNASVPRLLLQPLVENAIHHGIAPRTEGGEILISSRVDGDTLTLRVINDCPAFGKTTANGNRPGGVGIANTRLRLEKLYGMGQRLEATQPQPGRFEVTLSIPMVPLDAPGGIQNQVVIL